MVEARSNFLQRAPVGASSVWPIPFPLPPPIADIERRSSEDQSRPGMTQSAITGPDLNPGAPEYLWSAARAKRPDGRERAYQLRPMEAHTSIFAAAAGSCKLLHGETCIIAFVTGPVASSLRRTTNLSEAFCEVLVRPRTGVSQQNDKRLECELQKIVQSAVNVQLYPRTTLQVIVQVVSEDGPLLSTCANAICLALLDAGVNLRFTFAAACVAARPLKSRDREEAIRFLLDPTTDELRFCSGVVCLIFDVSTGGLIASTLEQDLFLVSTSEIDELIRLGFSAAISTSRFFRRQMKSPLKNIAITANAQNWYTLDT